MSWRQQRPTRRASAHPYIGRRMSEAEHKQQEANREAQRTGVEAEALVERMGAEYLRAEYAYIRKRSEPYRRIGGVGKGGVFRAVNTGASGPDFELWLADGRAGLLELKSRKGSRVPLDAVGGAQALALRRCVSWGHLALVLVRLDGVWWLVDYSAWTHSHKRSLNAVDLEAQGARVPVTADGFPDFLAVLERAQEQARVFCAGLVRGAEQADHTD